MNKKIKLWSLYSLMALGTFMFSSCATLFTGTKDRISFNTQPPGAKIFIKGVEEGVTPVTMKVKRSLSDTDVEFKLDGYETKLVTLSKEFNIISVINLGNLIGWGVDALTGSVMKYDKKTYDITLDNDKRAMIHPDSININTERNNVELYVSEEK